MDTFPRRLFLRYIRNPVIPDELRCGIFLEFLRRFQKYQTEDVLPSFILSQNACRLFHREKTLEEKEFFKKIALILEEWSNKNHRHSEGIYIFILYHSFYLPPEFINSLSTETERKKLALWKEIDMIREAIRNRVNNNLAGKVKSLGKSDILSFMKLNQNTGKGREELSLEKQKKIIKAISEIRFFPSWLTVQSISGIPAIKALYAYQKVIRAITVSFEDNVYWGIR